ncbi:MAG: hypothetical protein HQK79_22660 [Desulfobacterales bacterium]|nr:hypothetical protein [Desulfobacterales bacterium]
MNYNDQLSPDIELERFVYRFLEHNGAITEKKQHGYDTLLPENLAKLLEIPEDIHIKIGTNSEQKNVYQIHYGSYLLDRMIAVATTNIPLLLCRLEFEYIKTQGFDKLANEHFTFHGAIGTVENVAKANTEYLLLNCKFLAQSDEQKEGQIELIFNLDNGAYISNMASFLDLVEKKFESGKQTQEFAENRIIKIMEWVQKKAKEVIDQEISPFKESMNRRFKRDITNLEEYYESLKKEMEKSLESSRLLEESIADRKEKIALLPVEMARKKNDLYNKYSIKVKITPSAAMHIKTPVMKVLYKISVGKKPQTLSLIYNPVTKSFDPLVCRGCEKSIYSIYFCKNLHLLCKECSKICPVCK